jgi:hypothetical protein
MPIFYVQRGMKKVQSLAEYLGTAPPSEPDVPRLEDIKDPKAFAEAVLDSYEFRQYIVNGLRLGELPAAILIRVMDLAGWQKPPERVEHTGKDGEPIQTVTEVRRVVIRASEEEFERFEPSEPPKHTTH